MSKKRVGILTSGGDCPGLNAVIRGAVKACHQLGYDCVGFLKGYEGLYDPVQYVHLTPASTRGILNQGGSILGSTNKGRFAATVGVQDRQELDPVLMRGVKQTIDQLSIDGLICVGGDGSLAVAQQFHEQGIPVVGVPKTIDNDLSATAFTFGFDSAIECATDALDRLHTTAASHERIMVLEVMGRHAGWIALNSGIAGGGDVILIPEIDWTFEHVCHKILHRESQGKKFTLIVVAEGAQLPQGGMVGEHRAGQQMKLGGIGRAVTDEIGRRLHRETRLCVLGHLQRGGRPTTFDRVLATQFGAHAVRLVKEGRFGEMICSRPPEMTSVPIIEAVNVLRTVEPHGPGVQAARALGISFGDRPADAVGEDVFAGPEVVASPIFANAGGAFTPTSTERSAIELVGETELTEVDTTDADKALAESESTGVAAMMLEEAVAQAELPEARAAEELVPTTKAESARAVAVKAALRAPTTEVDSMPKLVKPVLIESIAAEETPAEELTEPEATTTFELSLDETLAALPMLAVGPADEESAELDEEPVMEELVAASFAAAVELAAAEVAASEVAESETPAAPADVEPLEVEAPETDDALELEIASQVADAHAALAERIAGLAERARDKAPEAVKVDAAALETLAPETKATTPAPAATEVPVLEFDVDSLVKRLPGASSPRKTVATTAKQVVLAADPATSAFDEDLLAEAKAALEAALGK